GALGAEHVALAEDREALRLFDAPALLVGDHAGASRARALGRAPALVAAAQRLRLRAAVVHGEPGADVRELRLARRPEVQHARVLAGPLAALEAPRLVVEDDDRVLGPAQPVARRLEDPEAVLPALGVGVRRLRVAVVDEHVPGTDELDRAGGRRGGG